MGYRIDIFTDGACSGNPGKGGYGVLMRIPQTNYQKHFSQGYRKTTNNRMELLAVIEALEKIKTEGNEIHIFTDSRYVADAVVKKWIYGWERRGFSKVKNPDLWQRFLPLYEKHKPEFHWLRGHSGHPENELCDQLAVQAAASATLLTDTYYEQQQENLL